MLPLLTQRLWDGLEKSQWFVIGEGEVYFVEPAGDRRGIGYRTHN